LQVAPLQSPEQHCAAPEQLWPPSRQLTATHAPLLHAPEQHWFEASHRALSSVHVPTHFPLLHTLEQQSRAFEQLLP
jgi:hypothetical protein